jgi:NTP pyrophosphatase (non-canonical NTP hydrolase)
MPIQNGRGEAAMEHKIKQKWQQRAVGIHDRFLKLAQAKGSLMSDSEVLSFLALAICGEAGELANLVKKLWRGDEVDRDQIRDEIADIRIYLEHISRHLDIDLDKACERKLDEVHDRLVAKEQCVEADVAP